VGFIAELKRRNVIRMAGVYLVGAWLVVQVAGTLLPLFGAPVWVPRALVLLLAIGFVPALVVSWLFELTPDGLKRDGEVPAGASIAAHTGQRMDRLILGGLLAVVALVAADRYWPRSLEPAMAPVGAETPVPATSTGPATAAPAVVPAAAPAPAANSIAVLPFMNMSADEDNAFFSDGITEELLNVLVRVDGLQVASRTSSFAFKGSDLGSRAIAGELQVSHLLEGSVRKSGNRVRITAQLIDAVNDRHLWSETYDRDLTDIFAIQDEIANAIVNALRGELPAAAGAVAAVKVEADTQNLTAYELYLKAREMFIARSELAQSVQLFERVVELDPGFARGWEGLAAAASVAEGWGIRDRDYTAISLQAAERALALDPGLSMPWAALSLHEQRNRPVDWAKALELVDKAIAADPKNATAYLWRSVSWMQLGFFDKAAADQQACLALDPAYRNCTRWMAATRMHAGRTAEALTLFDSGLPGGFVTNRSASFVPYLARRGDRTAALLLLNQMQVPPALAMPVVDALANGGVTREQAKGLIDRHASDPELPFAQSVGIAYLYLWLGDFDQVPPTIDPNGDESLTWDWAVPGWINSPGHKRSVKDKGLLSYWQQHQFPPQCRPLPGGDFECDMPKPP
jgi:TolB-like protein